MKKLLPILIISILILSGIGISAAPVDREVKPRNIQDWNLEIVVKGGLGGYTATVTNTGTEIIAGNLTIQVHTEPWIIIIGKDLETINDIELNPEDTLKYSLKSVFGFGKGHINVDAVFITETDTYIKSEVTDGFVFFIYCKCPATTVNVP